MLVYLRKNDYAEVVDTSEPGMWDHIYMMAYNVYGDFCLLPFRITGGTYAERKECLRDLAIDFQNTECGGLTYGEHAEVEDFFRRNGKRYGLLDEFNENGIC